MVKQLVSAGVGGSIPPGGRPFIMGSADTLQIYRACVENFREIESGRLQFEKLLNSVLRSRPQREIDKFTRIYSILFSSWAESRLLKLVYTPYGLSDSEIAEVLRQSSVEEKWKKTVEIGLAKLDSTSGKVANYKKLIYLVISRYVTEPAKLRNKFAHGQWKTALNSSCDKINPDTTALIEVQSPIDVFNWFYFFGRISDLIEILIESPTKAFHHDYWMVFAEIKHQWEKRIEWTLEDKIRLLKEKHRKVNNKRPLLLGDVESATSSGDEPNSIVREVL